MAENTIINCFTESGLSFDFNIETVKYDDDSYYKKVGKDMKAVDFLSYDSIGKKLLMIEVKNFEGHEGDRVCRERLSPEGEDPLDLEIAEKVRDTIAVLFGISKSLGKTEPLNQYYEYMINKEVKVIVIAFIEGKLTNYKKGHKDGASGLKRKIKKRVGWLNCEVMVLDTESAKEKFLMELFKVKKIADIAKG